MIEKIEQIHETLLDVFRDFVNVLKIRTWKGRMDTTLASESSLKKDWLCAEEEAAWRNL